MNDSNNTKSLHSWDTYWQGTGDIGAFSAGGVSHPAIAAFWEDFFTATANRHQATRLLDVATGNGAILEMARSKLDADTTSITCVDISEAAIRNVEQRFSGVVGVVADARTIPLDSGQFNLVTSQFGVEYAGLEAVAEAARLVSSGGQLALMMHIEGGIVHDECSMSLAAIEKLQASNFVPYAIELFDAGFAAVRGADRSTYEAAGSQMAPATRAAEAIMAEYGEGVAGDTIARLYSDVGRIHSDMPKYDPDEVLEWLRTMDRELSAYAERMSSMINVAIAAAPFEQLRKDLKSLGFTLVKAAPLYPTAESPALAWILIATR